MAFDVPMDELMMIYPDARKKLFVNMLENFKVFYPGLKRIYAALNFNSELRCDYLIIFEANQTRGNGKVILWDSPAIFTNRTLCGYRYAVKNNLHQDFFKEVLSHFSRMSSNKFAEYITSDSCNLSLTKGDPKFWKDPSNTETLMKAMEDLGLMYIPEGGYRSSAGFGVTAPHKPDSNPFPAEWQSKIQV